MSGGASLPANPSPAFQYPGMQGAAQGALGGIGGINTNPGQSYDAAGATQGGAALGQAGQSMLPWVQQILQTGFDPQKQQYMQMFQQQQDQGNAALAQQGLAGTPYGAGIAQQGNQNFDINWQNQQLGRQNQALQGAGAGLGAAGSAIGQGAGIGQGVVGFENQQKQQQIADFLAYLQGGTGATNAGTSQYGAESSAALQNQGLQNQNWSGIGQLGGNLLGMFL